MADGVDIEATGLLDGLEGGARVERNELIEWLLERGFSIDEIRTAIAPMLLPAGRLMGDDGTRLSANQICADTGLDLELLQALQRALGLSRVDDPDAAVHLRADADAAARATEFLALGLRTEQVVAVARILGQGLAPAAEVMRQAVLDAVLRPGVSEMQIAQEYEALVRRIAPLLAPMLEDVLRLHLRHGLETEAVNAAEREAGALPGARKVTIAFADLVGFTRLGEAVPPEELELLARRLTELARDVAAAPVRFVKTIGDAVMFVSPDARLLLDAMMELVGAADSDDFPSLRVGVAFGSAVSRAGDWFGSPVNLASRVSGVARPGAVLVTEPVREAIGDAEQFSWSFAGARHLKGVSGDVKLFRARRRAA